MIFPNFNYPKPLSMKVLILFLTMLSPIFLCAQSITGSWQQTKETTCMEETMESLDEDFSELKDDMKSMSSRTPQVIEFKDNNTGVESVRIIDTRKSSGKSSFLYKLEKNNLYILDKKSQTIKGAYTVEKLSSDSLILSNSSRPCETRVFVRIK